MTLPENTVLLVPVRNEKLLGIVLSKMNITLATTRCLSQPQSDYPFNGKNEFVVRLTLQ